MNFYVLTWVSLCWSIHEDFQKTTPGCSFKDLQLAASFLWIYKELWEILECINAHTGDAPCDFKVPLSLMTVWPLALLEMCIVN
jgi:hypothetical protein